MLCILLAAAPGVGAVKGYYLGDADGDGEVSIVDATVILRKMASMNVAYLNEKAADIDGDGLDVVDATLIQRHLVQMSVPFPIGTFIAEQQDSTDDLYELPIV